MPRVTTRRRHGRRTIRLRDHDDAAPGIYLVTVCSHDRAPSLGAIIGSFKSAVTKAINEVRGTPGAVVWQRNYYEQIVTDLEAAREYIRNNRP
jgi:hypothetical protein